MKKIRIILNCAIAIVLVVLTADYDGRPLLKVVSTLEQQTFDWRLARNAQNPEKNTDIVIIDIDRDSLRREGSWPWSRDLLANMLVQLFEKYRVRAAVFTFPLTDADDDGLTIFDQVYGEIKEKGNIEYTQNLVKQLEEVRQEFDYDNLLAQAMRENPVFLGYRFDNSARVEGVLPPPVEFRDEENINTKISIEKMRDLTETIDVPEKSWHFYRGFSGNLKKILDASQGAGFVGLAPDNDGFVRRLPMAAYHAKKYYESLPIMLLRRVESPGQVIHLIAEHDDNAIDSLYVGRKRAYINQRGEMYLNFAGSGGRFVDFENQPNAIFRYVSATDVIRGKVENDGKPLTDAIALIGSSSESLRDIHSTPLNSQMPGVELLATGMANVIDGKVLHRPRDLNFNAFVALSVLALVAAVVFALIGPLLSSVITVLLCGGFVYTAIDLWDSELQVVNMVSPLLVFIGLFMWNSISGFVFEWRSSKNLKSSFGQYVPPELAKRIGEQHSHSISLEGESRVISVLFSDVRNFTAISETFTPVDLTRMMNRMLTVLSEAVHVNSGTVDKFIGDAVMAFWNAPLEDPQHALNALKGAMAMQSEMKKLSVQLQKEGHPAMNLGVGICTGEANVGNMGSKLRMAYTAMGDTVNVASRVEGLTKHYKVGILVTESTYEMCKDSNIAFRLVDMVRVKGRVQALSIYEPMGDKNLLAPEQRTALNLYSEMHAAYTAGDFALAQQKVLELRKAVPNDGLGKVYEERIAHFIENPPTEWDGTTNFEVK